MSSKLLWVVFLTLLILPCATGLPFEGHAKSELYSSRDSLNIIEAVEDNDLKRLAAVINAGADINERGFRGVSILYWFVLTDNIKGYEVLLRLSADPNHCSDSGSCLLHVLALENKSNYIRLAVKYGADVDLQMSGFGRTPLMNSVAAFGKEDSAFQTLLKAGADPYTKHSMHGTTVFSSAVLFERFDLVIFLVELGFVDLPREARVALTYAVKKKSRAHLPAPLDKQFVKMKEMLELKRMIDR